MTESIPDLVERVLSHLVELRSGLCGITEEAIFAEPDPGMQQVLAGLLFLHEDLDYRARQRDEMEARLVEAKTAAEAAARAKSTFLAQMSHEVRTPLTAIIGLADLLGYSELDAAQRADVKTISDASQNLLAIINNVLDFAKVEAGRIVLEQIPLDLVKVITAVVAQEETAARKKELTMRVDLPQAAPPPLQGDPTRFRQVVTNLVSNAVKFTSEGGVVVRADWLSSGEEQVTVHLEVRDTGPGIPVDKQELIFSPFAQAESFSTRRHGGTGLGLAIARELAQLMGGSIEVESRVGEGSSFRLQLPLRVVENAAQSEAPEVERSVRFDARVLVVDDNLEAREVIARLLRRMGCRVEIASDGEQAVSKVRASSFDLIFMDCQMPTVDGFEATARIRADEVDGCRVPIVALTAHVGDRDECLAAGMDDYLTKPTNHARLEAMLSRWADGPADA